MLLKDVRDYIASLGITEDKRCYCGVLPDKADKSIGVYNPKHPPPLRVPIGGMPNSTYGIKSVTILIHWNKSPTETEQAAVNLHKALVDCKSTEVNGWMIKFIQVAHAEPIGVGTDDKGVHEHVIECELYYDKERG